MPKNMALIEDGSIINMLWCSDTEPQTETLIDPGDHPVGIGDSYTDGKFYRNGVEILTPLEQAWEENAELLEDMANLVEDVYQGDLEMMSE